MPIGLSSEGLASPHDGPHDQLRLLGALVRERCPRRAIELLEMARAYIEERGLTVEVIVAGRELEIEDRVARGSVDVDVDAVHRVDDVAEPGEVDAHEMVFADAERLAQRVHGRLRAVEPRECEAVQPEVRTEHEEVARDEEQSGGTTVVRDAEQKHEVCRDHQGRCRRRSLARCDATLASRTR